MTTLSEAKQTVKSAWVSPTAKGTMNTGAYNSANFASGDKYDYDLDDQFSPFYSQGGAAADPVFSGSGASKSAPANSYYNEAGTLIVPGSSQFRGLNSALSNDGNASGSYDYGSYGTLGAGNTEDAAAKTQYKPPTGSTTITTGKTTYTGTKPEMGDRPELDLPEWGDEEDRAVRARAQKISGSDILSIKQALQQAAGKTYRNPLAASFTLSRALQQAGVSMGKVRSSAENVAESAERQEFMDERSRIAAEHADQVSAWQTEYTNLWNEYLSTAETTNTSTQRYSYDSPISDGAGMGGMGVSSLSNPTSGSYAGGFMSANTPSTPGSASTISLS